jgi:hypothetical protein
MAKLVSFKDMITVERRPGMGDQINYKVQKQRRTQEDVEQTDEELSISGRRKLARVMKRRKSQLKRARERAKKRMAKKDVLAKRARRQARGQAAKVLTKGKNKADLSVAQKKNIEKRLAQQGWQQRINVLNKRLMPKVRRQEIGRKR